MPCTATSGRSSPEASPAGTAETRAPRGTRPNQDSTRSAPIREIPCGPFVAPTLNRRFVVHAPRTESSRVSSKTPLADHPIRGKIPLAAFRSRFFANRTNVCFSPRDRDALEIERASIGRDARRFRTRDRRTDARRTYGARSSSYVRRYVSIYVRRRLTENEITPSLSLCVVSSLRLLSQDG